MNSALFVALACALVAAVSAANPDFDADWKLFKFTQHKTYPTKDHEAMRREIWEANLARISKHNLRFQLGKESYEVGMNKLGDMTTVEIKTMLNGFKPKPSSFESFIPRETFVATKEADKTVDWREKGVVTPVKNQGQCGSCWAFSATGSLEGQHAIKTKKLVSLSEQELVDCSGSEGNQGCNGGWMDWAFKYILKNKGIDTEEAYPYTAEDGDCHPKKNAIGATLTGFVDIMAKDEGDLTKAISEKGPVSVAIDASQFGFQFYKSGIYYSEDCSEDQLDHGVLAVGYGDNGGANGKYYIVKNSWDSSWGDKGYLKMSRDRDNNCGIATKASYPKV